MILKLLVICMALDHVLNVTAPICWAFHIEWQYLSVWFPSHLLCKNLASTLFFGPLDRKAEQYGGCGSTAVVDPTASVSHGHHPDSAAAALLLCGCH